ncbi:AAA family ATPase [bacterium]|nr:AAA family ATPase [bacterium]
MSTAQPGTASKALGIRSYLPTFEEMVGNSKLLGLLKHQLTLPVTDLKNILLVGPPGSGKSAAARRYAESICGHLERPELPSPGRKWPKGNSGYALFINGGAVDADLFRSIASWDVCFAPKHLIFVDEFGLLFERGLAESLRVVMDNPAYIVIGTAQSMTASARRLESVAERDQRREALLRRMIVCTTEDPTEKELFDWTLKQLKKWTIGLDHPKTLHDLILVSECRVGRVVTAIEKAASYPEQQLTRDIVQEVVRELDLPL